MVQEKISSFIQKCSGKKYSLLTGSGTSSIYLALKASNLPKGALIAVSNISCPDVVYALIWAGYKPIFVDVEKDDYNISIEALEKTLQANSLIRGIIAVHLFGAPCDIKKIRALSDQYGLFLIEDCAQSLGNSLEGTALGSFGDVSIFSFGNGKIIEAGHGGSLQSDDKSLIERARKTEALLPKFSQRKADLYSKFHRKLYYKLYQLRKKSRLFNYFNLIFVFLFRGHYLHRANPDRFEQIFRHIDEYQNQPNSRMITVKKYQDAFRNHPEIKIPSYAESGHQLSRFTIWTNQAELISQLIRDAGIPSNTMYPLLIDRFRLFFNKSDYPNSFYLNDKLLNLWTSHVTDEQISKTISIVSDTIRKTAAKK